MNTDSAILTPPAWIAVAGNPNSGKTTLFNSLTGLSQNVGNYPGVTVEKKTGNLDLGDRSVTLIDVPGAYSLAANSPDEQVVLDVLAGRVDGIRKPDVVCCVVDAVNLKRNLFLTSQIADMGIPMVIALNMIDLAELQGMKIDTALLEKQFGVPVIQTCATSGRGFDDLKRALSKALDEKPMFTDVSWPEAVSELGGPDWESRRRLFDAASEETADQAKLREAGLDPVSIEAVERYRHIESLIKNAVTKPDRHQAERAYRIDRILTHRFWGLIIFFGVMLGVFSSIYWLAAPMMEGIDALFGALADWVGPMIGTPWLQSFITDGVIAGVGGVVIFLPQILILFLFIAILEDSGYMARAAFLMDRVFKWTGLNGKSFVPMLSSFACAVPAIMGARTIEDRRARLTTVLVSPLMSCSARLPVYVLLIGVFIEPVYGWLWAGVALFAMHLVGLFVAIPIAFIINKLMLRMKSLPFLMELPPYRRPRWKQVGRRMYLAGKEFVIRAGTIILIFSVIIWALTYFPATDAATPSAQLEESYMGQFGKAVQPVFAPAGFDWKVTVGVLASFPAREVIISTLGIIYSVEEEKVGGAMAASLTLPVALAIMVFFALCLQCGSTVAVMVREVGWKWATFAFVYMTGLAWVGAVVTYQIGAAIQG